MADTIYNIPIPGSYLEKTTPAERLVMISPNVNMIPKYSDDNTTISISTTVGNKVNLSFAIKYNTGVYNIGRIYTSDNSSGDSFEIYRGLIRLTPMNTMQPIIFNDNFKYPKNNKGYDQYGRIFYIVDSGDNDNSVYIWYYSDRQIPFQIETITPISTIEGVCF